MDSEASLPPVLQIAESSSVAPRARRLRTTTWKTVVFIWKYFVGVLLCQSILGAVAVIGWTYRLSQRVALRYWWSRSECKQAGTRFPDHLTRHDAAHEHLHWPNWFGAQNFTSAIRRGTDTSRRAYAWQLIKAPLRSLAFNIKVGLQGIFNTWVLTMPACILWLFSWYDGWNNSFNKGYEQAIVGPGVGVLGIFVFIAAMMYVPLAQARQAVTGDWRSFYNFSFVWRLVRRHWLACLILAGLTSLFFLPLIIMKTAPQFFGTGAKLANMTDKQVIQFLNGYFFACAFLVFPLFVALRVLAARIYARGILHGVQTGEISVTDLASRERLELQRLNLIQVNPPRSRHVLLRVARSTSSLVLFGAGIWATAFLWFTFVAQLYISEFFSYHGMIGWLNQPLIQLPWFRYVPAHAQNPAGEFFLTILILAFAFGIPALVRRVRKIFVVR